MILASSGTGRVFISGVTQAVSANLNGLGSAVIDSASGAILLPVTAMAVLCRRSMLHTHHVGVRRIALLTMLNALPMWGGHARCMWALSGAFQQSRGPYLQGEHLWLLCLRSRHTCVLQMM